MSEEEEYFEDFEDEEFFEDAYFQEDDEEDVDEEAKQVFAMAEEISALAPPHIAEFQFPEKIENALREAGRMGKNAARKRLLKYITAQFRTLDTEAIQEKLARMKNRSAHAVREHHQAERWRDALLSDSGNQHLTQLLSEYPDADSQHLRQLQRNALKEAKEGKPPKSARLLYQALKQIVSDAETPSYERADVTLEDDSSDQD
jgi:ribosome-associated protein